MIDLIIEYVSQHLTTNTHFPIANQEAQITYFVSNEMNHFSYLELIANSEEK